MKCWICEQPIEQDEPSVEINTHEGKAMAHKFCDDNIKTEEELEITET